MKYYLEPSGWPSEISAAPNGLLARVRKGRMLLYFKTGTEVYLMTGEKTTLTGTIVPVELRIEK